MKKYLILSCILLLITTFAACGKVDNIDSVTTSTIATESVSTTIETTIESTEISKSTKAETTTFQKAETQTTQRSIIATTKKSTKSTKPSSSGNNSKPSDSGSSSSNNSGGSSNNTSTPSSKPTWCWEGGSKHVISVGIGWYSSYNSARDAALQYLSTHTAYTHWEVQECDCGKFTAYVR